MGRSSGAGSGAQGAQGATGAQGAQGGIQGPQGAQGTAGTPGGAQGSQGSQGAQGFTGVQGVQGSQGSQGAQGSQGSGSQGAQGAAGSGGAGAAVVRKFPFAFNTTGISSPSGAIPGAALYTPTAGDVLLNAWIEIDTAWNGTTPHGDLFAGDSLSTGLFSYWTSSTVDMSVADFTANGLVEGIAANGLAEASYAYSLARMVEVFGSGPSLTLTSDPVGNGSRAFPAKMVGADPIRLVVSTTGGKTGNDPGATQGAAVLYLVTATPV